MSKDTQPDSAAQEEIERLRARVLELEAENAILRGTLSRYDATEDDQPIVIHDVPGNAPR